MNKITVSKITNNLFWADKDIAGWRTPDYVLASGQIIHSRLGFSQMEYFQRVYRYNDEYWLIGGRPDRIDWKNGILEELKSYRKTTKRIQEITGRITVQLYMFLTGLRNSKLYLYNSEINKMREIVEIPFRWTQANRAINAGIQVQLKRGDWSGELREIRKEFTNGNPK